MHLETPLSLPSMYTVSCYSDFSFRSVTLDQDTGGTKERTTVYIMDVVSVLLLPPLGEEIPSQHVPRHCTDLHPQDLFIC